MGTKKGHNKYLKGTRRKFLIVLKYPHRRHHKGKRKSLKKEGIRLKKEFMHIRDLEKEIEEYAR